MGGDEPYGVNFTENWISVDPKVDYDKTRASVEAAVAGYPGLYRDVQTYLRERIKEVLTGAGESIVVRIFGPDCRRFARRRSEVADALKDIPGLIDLHVEQQVDVPQVQVKLDLEKRRALRAQARRRAPRRGRSDVRHRSDRHPSRRQGVRRVGLVAAVIRARCGRHSRVPDRHALRRARAAGRSGGRAPRADAEQDQAGEQLAAHRHPRATSRVATSARWPTRSRIGSRRCSSRSATTRSCWANTRNARLRKRTCSCLRLRLRSLIFLILHASFGDWRLATLIFLALPAALVGGLLARIRGRPRDLARVPCRDHYGPGYRSAQQHPAHPALPASRARGR